ncbi:sialic acid-binding Ig-like lectin 14 isoform X2 [Gadus chalcogrammus]|uniref:sialic acid-binding Ig-like lectin 14 isoform X2 n=1 Tax=Gadus chalcogrammus TaxID=1042646 RepID=UPI0024C42782|nr:sialic acid-binding Ig-like lectin 14 isoform X2 [Gadus chalcogrammus]
MTGSWRVFLLCSLLQGAGCYQRFEALMPERVTTLSGSCVTVPCSFTLEDRIDCGDGRWEIWNQLKYSFKENPVTFMIKGLPDAPRLTPPKEPVVEGTPVELGCSAPSYCDTHPPTVTWTPALGLSTQLQQNDTVTSTLTFNASLLHHGNNVSCTAAYYIPSGNKTVTSTIYKILSISYAPRNTSAVGSPCLPAREGGCLNLTCSSHANPAVSEVTWYRIHREHILKIGTGSSLSIQLWNANNVFFCEVRNDFGTEKSTVYKIDIQIPSQIFNIPDLVLCIGKSAVIFVGIVCVVVCIIRTRKVGEETRSFNAATVKRAPPDEEESQVTWIQAPH